MKYYFVDFVSKGTILLHGSINGQSFLVKMEFVVKTRRRADAVCAIFRLAVLIFCQCACKYCFFAFCCKNWRIWWMNGHPFSSKGGATCFLMVHIPRYFEANCMCNFLRFLQLCSSFHFHLVSKYPKHGPGTLVWMRRCVWVRKNGDAVTLMQLLRCFSHCLAPFSGTVARLRRNWDGE